MLNFRRYAALINRVLFRNSTSELIDRAVVEAAYRVLLGREPESEDIVRLHQATSPTEMLVRFVGTNDFQLRHAVARIEKSLTLLPEKIEANADPSELRQMIARVGEAWTSLGREEPHWLY